MKGRVFVTTRESLAGRTVTTINHKLSQDEVATADYVDVLLQRKWWRKGNGEVMRRRDMDINHVVNSLGYLLREAQRIVYSYTGRREFWSAPEEVWSELDRMNSAPEEWMKMTPMWQALLIDVISFADISPEDLGLELVLPSEVAYSMTKTYWRQKS